MEKDYEDNNCNVEENDKTPINSVAAELEDKWEDEMSNKSYYHSSNGFWWNRWA